MLDVVSLRHGVPIGDIVSATLPRTFEVPSVTGPAAPPPPAPPPAPAVPGRNHAEIRTLRSGLNDVRKKLADSEKKNKDLETRIKKLER